MMCLSTRFRGQNAGGDGDNSNSDNNSDDDYAYGDSARFTS